MLCILSIITQLHTHLKSTPRASAYPEMKNLVYEGFEEVTPDRWKSLIRHVEDEVS